ncbi:flagellar basal body L-ring protein FlgH [Parvularcula sp. IMCC14364]|uniref:flagellar basal body L-ring protein FlgH n=1 Tax=Parvularcula sp. IMCC14364 TaxID=3067902 RepID=UPI0027422E0D|nr:flagellar basal body L-ring protein FlgH [Parvularcula sp. IMCC14364]
MINGQKIMRVCTCLGLLAIFAAACSSSGKKLDIYEQNTGLAPLRESAMAVTPPQQPQTTASLWKSGPSSLFGDRRAKTMGDILTVVVNIDDEAQIQNSVTANRTNNEQFSVNDLFGLPEWANNVLPGGADLNPGVNLDRTRATTGNGNISRQEEITLRLAARVVDVLPNGHLVVAGTQEISVNYEARQLQVTGIVRPEDISRQNIITYDKIAEARIAYGGKGQVTRTVAPKSGNRFLNAVIPF